VSGASRLARSILARHPAWAEVPGELDRTWGWLQEQDVDGELGGAVFADDVALDPWFAPSPAPDALLPIGWAAPDGSILALWRDDAGRVRAVVLGSEGDGYGIADDARELLALLALGLDELTSFGLVSEPDGEPSELLVAYRDWAARELGVQVPEVAPLVGDDAFSAWLDAVLGREAPPSAAADGASGAFAGDVLEVVGLIDEPDAPETTARVAALSGVALTGALRSAGRRLESVGVELQLDRRGIQTIWITVEPGSLGARLVTGLDADSTLDDALALLGEPERRGDAFARYVVRGRFVHLEFAPDRLSRITVMRDAP
jgi:hypothetical protein